jgi:hypothetical protein
VCRVAAGRRREQNDFGAGANSFGAGARAMKNSFAAGARAFQILFHSNSAPGPNNNKFLSDVIFPRPDLRTTQPRAGGG